MSASVLITGASGFIGSAAHRYFSAAYPGQVIAAARQGAPSIAALSPDTDPDTCRALMAGVDCVIHAAAQAHVLSGNVTLEEFRKTNVDWTASLARIASEAGVRRFIFLSSVGVMGRYPGRPFRECDHPAPVSAYGHSKLLAEKALQHIGETTSMEVCIVRLPLVYGVGAKGNLHNLLQWLDSGVPLPFKSLSNRRSLLSLDNLMDVLNIAISHPAAGNETFFAADDVEVSTPQIITALASGMGRSPRLWPCPYGVLKGAASVVGRSQQLEKLCGSLVIDAAKLREALQWRARFEPLAGLRAVGEGYADARRNQS